MTSVRDIADRADVSPRQVRDLLAGARNAMAEHHGRYSSVPRSDEVAP